ncbi:hypothetical protein [Aeromonas bivalvium]
MIKRGINLTRLWLLATCWREAAMVKRGINLTRLWLLAHLLTGGSHG